jgi:cytochrome c-type biogenesis protein
MAFAPLLLLAAFGGGILSILSPCVVSLLPSYLAYLAGTSLEEVPDQPTARWRVSRHALWFVLGCTLLLTLLGMVAALVGSSLDRYQLVLERIAGVPLILFGVALTGLLPIPWVSWDHHVQVKPGRSTWWRSGLLGVTFGASWSACAGPILGSILVLTAVHATLVLQGAGIMLAFALGQGVPLLLVSLLVDRAGPFLRRLRPYTARLTQVGGGILILLGVFLAFGWFSTAG